MTNQCVICGCEIPDGKQVCTGCEIKSNADLEADLKAAHEEIGRLKGLISKSAKQTKLDQKAVLEKVRYALHDTIDDFCNESENEIAYRVDEIGERWKRQLGYLKAENAELKGDKQ